MGPMFLVHQKKLYIRHKSTPAGEPFQEIKISEMKVDKSAKKKTYENDDTKKRFKWTSSSDHIKIDG